MLLWSLLLMLPGVVPALYADEEDPLTFAAWASICGLSIWVVGFWFLRWLPLSLSGLATGVSVLSLVAVAASRRRLLARVRRMTATQWGWAPLAFGLAAIGVRMFVYARYEAPSGADMSMHSYMARLILEANAVPESHQPLLPVDDFGGYAAGLPTLSALLAGWSGKSVVAAGLFIACLTHALTSLAVYAFLRERFTVGTSVAVAALATFATRDPQRAFAWGGNPTVLAFVFGTMTLIATRRLFAGSRSAIPLAGLLAAAAVLTHLVIPMALCYVLLVLVGFALSSKRVALPQLFRAGLPALVSAVVLILPYALGFQLDVSPSERSMIREWQLSPSHVPPGPAWLLPLSSLYQVGARLGPFLLLWLVPALFVLHRFRQSIDRFETVSDLLFAGSVLLLVLNAFRGILPGSPALYPDRIMFLFLLPAANLIAHASEVLRQQGVNRARAFDWLRGAVVASAALGLGLYWFRPLSEISVTEDDLRVIDWIGVHTAKSELIENNYGDAGLWIPALIFRPIHEAHVNFVYTDEIKDWKSSARPSLLFVGARAVYPRGIRFTEAIVRQQPARYQELFRSGAAAVYRITDP